MQLLSEFFIFYSCHRRFVEYGILQNAMANRRTLKKMKVLSFAEHVLGKLKNLKKMKVFGYLVLPSHFIQKA